MEMIIRCPCLMEDKCTRDVSGGCAVLLGGSCGYYNDYMDREGLLKYFDAHGLRIEDTYRIGFRLAKQGGEGNGL